MKQANKIKPKHKWIDYTHSSMYPGSPEIEMQAIKTILEGSSEHKNAIDLVAGKRKYSEFESYDVEVMLAMEITKKNDLLRKWQILLEGVHPKKSQFYLNEMVCLRIDLNTKDYDRQVKDWPEWFYWFWIGLTGYAIYIFLSRRF